MMHPWVRDDCGHELYSPLLLQYIPNPRAGWLDGCTETCLCGISWRQRVLVGLRVPCAWHEGSREGGRPSVLGKHVCCFNTASVCLAHNRGAFGPALL